VNFPNSAGQTQPTIRPRAAEEQLAQRGDIVVVVEERKAIRGVLEEIRALLQNPRKG
jgi:hypothetical protein